MTHDPIKVIRRSTTSVEQIYADVRSHFINAKFDILPEERRARKRTHTSILLQDVRIDQFEPVGGDLSGIGGDFYHLGFLNRGAVLVKRPRLELHNVPGGVGTLDVPGGKFSLVTTPDTMGYVVALSPAALLRAGRVLIGDHFRLSEDVTLDMRNAAGRALARNATAMFHEVGELEKIGLSQLATTSYAELLSNLAIAAMHPEDFLFEDDRMSAPTRLVAKAEEVIRARAHEPLSIRDIAAELGITVRSLQLGFRKHLGRTPLQFLLERRLALARERLLDPQFGGNVQYVAMSCGFVNMSKFSSRYRATFGELPSATLARGRRR